MGTVRNLSRDVHRKASGGDIRASRVSKKIAKNEPSRLRGRTKKIAPTASSKTTDELLLIERFESVWEALGFEPEEAANLEARAGLMRQIEKIIKKNRWTQATAAKHCGVSQPRINDLLRGRIDRFSIDALVNMAACLGQKVHIRLKAA